MNYLSPLFGVLLLTGAVFVIMAIILKYYPPKKINPLYGYRTELSMKNQFNWDLGQKISTTKMLQGGLMMLLLSLSGLFLNWDPLLEVLLGVGVLILISILLYISTERELKKQIAELDSEKKKIS